MIRKSFLLVIIYSAILFGQDAGNSGLSFLKNGASARSISAGDIGQLNGDLSSVFYNPASINFQESASIMFTHQAWIQDLRSEILNTGFTFWGLPFNVGVNTTKMSGFEARSNPTDEPDATFDVNFFYGSISTGFTLYEKLDFGISIKYLYESFLSDDASGTGYDFGLIYSDVIDDLTIGASLRNIGSMDKLREEKTQLPSDLILNSTYKLIFSSVSLNVNPVIGVQKFLESDDLHIHFGAETIYKEQFSLRLGYITGYDSKGFTAGAGVYWNGFNIDYAFVPFNFGIGNANTISLMYTF